MLMRSTGLIDALLGGSNVATLIGDCALMVGIFFLGRGVMKAGEYQPGPVRIALGPAALLVALSGVVVAFLLIDRGATTTNFMIDLGAQPAAAAYSMIQFTYYGIVVGTMAVLASRQYRLSAGLQRLPAGSLVVGAHPRSRFLCRRPHHGHRTRCRACRRDD